MRSIISITILICVFFNVSPVFTQESSSLKAYIEGSWLGAIEVNGTKLRMVLKLHLNEKDSLTCLIDSPDQGVKDINPNKLSLKGDTLLFKINNIRASYTGIYNSIDSTFKGVLKQGMEMPMSFKKTDNPPQINRPQEPKPPYSYIIEEHTIHNKKANLDLSATLTIPKTDDPVPAIILISGSGPQNRNEELLGHKPFHVIADYLSDNGIAVLRYDDRGIGKSTGNFAEATSFDFAEDASAAFEFLKTHSKIDAGKIGLAGHSEGGLIAPIVAAGNKDVAFIVLLAGPGLSGEEILLLQARLISQVEGIEEADIELTLRINKKSFQIAINEKDPDKAYDMIKAVFEDETKHLSKEEKKEKGYSFLAVSAAAKQVVSPWFKVFLSYDPFKTLTKVKCPVLALNGEKDLQVPPDENLKVIEEALKEGKNSNFKILRMPGLNHLFQNCETGAVSEYATIDETFSPEALKIIQGWITDVTGLDE